MKKILALILALIMVVSLIACGKTEDPKPNTDPKPSESTPAESKPDDSTGEDREFVTLKWYVAHGGPQADTEAVMAEVNKYLKEKLNCELVIVESDFGSYTDKMQMVIGSGEEFDICWTANWCNNFYTNVSKNAFLELDELVDEYAPELKALVPEGGWDACRVNGNLYAVPSMQIWAMTNNLRVKEDIAAQYNFDLSTVKTLADIEPLFAAYKADHPETYPLAVDTQGVLAFQTFSMGYDELAGRHIPGVVMLDDEELKVVNQFELPQVKAFYEMMYDWAQKGYIRPDAATVSDYKPDIKNGLHIATFDGTYKPSDQTANDINVFGTKLSNTLLSESYLTTSGITATMNAISRTSKNPGRALEFLQLLNTDPYLYNLITQGIAGKHYEELGDGYIKPIENSGYAPNADWMYGNQFLAYLKEGQGKDDWTKTEELNASATPSVAMGFVFDPTPVQSEIASVSAVISEYETGLCTGVLDPNEYLPEFLEKLDQAGAETIIAEVQKQLDAWAEANK